MYVPYNLNTESEPTWCIYDDYYKQWYEVDLETAEVLGEIEIKLDS